jgi:two-component system sensor histidine kinase GlrK
VLTLQLIRNLDQIEEFTQKFFVTADPDYGEQVTATQQAFSRTLGEIRLLRLSPAEARDLDLLQAAWNQALRATRAVSPDRSTPERLQAALPDELARLENLRAQTLGFLLSTRQAVEAQVQESALASRRAQRVSSAAALAALLASLGVSFWIVRSISQPLGRLTEATRAVAAGRFSYRLEVEGRDELSQLARDFDAMTARLNELELLKRDFISHVSHELKSPLASIQETLRLLHEEIPGPLAPAQRRFLELSLQSARRLSSMIGDLLDLSRIEAGVMEYRIESCDLTELLRTGLAEFEVQFQEKNLRLEVQAPEQPVPIACDGDRILQVIGNVLGNAWKVSPEGSVVVVRLRSLAEPPRNAPSVARDGSGPTPPGERGYALISIADSGPGIPDAEKELIFEKFRQVRAAPSQERSRPATKLAGRGVGLGLAIARTIMTAHRGAIWVEDNPAGGSVFQILLPAGTASVTQHAPTTAPI